MKQRNVSRLRLILHRMFHFSPTNAIAFVGKLNLWPNTASNQAVVRTGLKPVPTRIFKEEKGTPSDWRLASLIEIIILMMNQTRVIDRANASRSNRVLNPASVRLNPRSRSNMVPTLRRIIN